MSWTLANPLGPTTVGKGTQPAELDQSLHPPCTLTGVQLRKYEKIMEKKMSTPIEARPSHK